MDGAIPRSRWNRSTGTWRDPVAGRGALMQHELPRRARFKAVNDATPGSMRSQRLYCVCRSSASAAARMATVPQRQRAGPIVDCSNEALLFNPRPSGDFFSGPFYGRYVGPEGQETGPLTPVDKAA